MQQYQPKKQIINKYKGVMSTFKIIEQPLDKGYRNQKNVNKREKTKNRHIYTVNDNQSISVIYQILKLANKKNNEGKAQKITIQKKYGKNGISPLRQYEEVRLPNINRRYRYSQNKNSKSHAYNLRDGLSSGKLEQYNRKKLLRRSFQRSKNKKVDDGLSDTQDIKSCNPLQHLQVLDPVTNKNKLKLQDDIKPTSQIQITDRSNCLNQINKNPETYHELQIQKIMIKIKEKEKQKQDLINQLKKEQLSNISRQKCQQIDPLILQTSFSVQNQQIQIKNDMKQFQNRKVTQKKTNILPKLPSLKDTAVFIKNYIPRNGEIVMKELLSSPQFQIIQQKNEKDIIELYFGQIQNDVKHGKGISITKKVVFEGSWLNGQKNQGLERTQLGNYLGNFKANKRHGQGQFFWPHEEYYSGEWSNGKKNGNGYWKTQQDSYIGEWVNGQVSGYGVYTKANSKYQGEFRNFLKHGYGKEYFSNGDKFEGNYVSDKPEGKGYYFWKCGYVYEGQFLMGKRHGHGAIFNDLNYQFKGQFINNYVEGKGIINFSNGDIFVGNFERNQKNGQGVYNLKSEHKIIQGIWKDNELQSISKFYTKIE